MAEEHAANFVGGDGLFSAEPFHGSDSDFSCSSTSVSVIRFAPSPASTGSNSATTSPEASSESAAPVGWVMGPSVSYILELVYKHPLNVAWLQQAVMSCLEHGFSMMYKNLVRHTCAMGYYIDFSHTSTRMTSLHFYCTFPSYVPLEHASNMCEQCVIYKFGSIFTALFDMPPPFSMEVYQAENALPLTTPIPRPPAAENFPVVSLLPAEFYIIHLQFTTAVDPEFWRARATKVVTFVIMRYFQAINEGPATIEPLLTTLSAGEHYVTYAFYLRLNPPNQISSTGLHFFLKKHILGGCLYCDLHLEYYFVHFHCSSQLLKQGFLVLT